VAVNVTWVLAVILCIVPFAGIWLGLPGWGAALGTIAAVVCLALIRYGKRSGQRELALVLAVWTGMCCSSTIYFRFRKPRKDYLQFTRDAVSMAAGEEISILAPDEIFDGLLPMVTGRIHPEVKSPDQVTTAGLYVWADSHGRILQELHSTAAVSVLLSRETGHYRVLLARIQPRGR